MFSAVYGPALSMDDIQNSVGDGGQGLSPIEPDPDSVVPHTSPIAN